MGSAAKLCLFLLLVSCASSQQPGRDSLVQPEEEDHIDSEFGVRSLDPNVRVYRVADVPRQRQVAVDDDEEVDYPDIQRHQPHVVGRRPPSSRGWSYDTRQERLTTTKRPMGPVIHVPMPVVTHLKPVPLLVKRPIARKRRVQYRELKPAATASTTASPPSSTISTTTPLPIVLRRNGATSVELIAVCIVCGLAIAILCAAIVYGIILFARRLSQRKSQRRSMGSRMASVIRVREPIVPPQGPLLGPTPEEAIIPALDPNIQTEIPLVVLSQSQQPPHSKQTQVLSFKVPNAEDEKPLIRDPFPPPATPIIPNLGPLMSEPAVPLTVLPDATPSAKPSSRQKPEHIVVQVTAPMQAASPAPSSTSSSSGTSEPPVLDVIGQRVPDHESVGIDHLPEEEVQKILHPNKRGA